MTAESRT